MDEQHNYDEQLTKSFRFQNRELLDNYVILAVTDTDGIMKHVSTNLCNVFGYKPSELIGKPYTFLIKKDSLISFDNTFKETQELKTMWKGDIKHASKTDETLWTDTIITPLFNDNKEHLGFIFASHDISKEKKLQKINEDNLLKKKHDKDVLDFMPSLSSAVLLKTSSGLHKILWIIAFTIIFLLLWSGFSQIDDIVKTEGKIVTTENIQKISSLNGGILKERFVNEGDNVKQGDKIVKISDADFKIDYEKNSLSQLALLAKLERLKAEASGESIQINEIVANINQQIMDNEVELYNANKKKLYSSIAILEEQLKQRKSDLNEAQKSLSVAKENKILLEQEMKIKKPLVEERIISQVDLLQLQRQLNDINSEIKSLQISIPSLRASIKEINESIQETAESYKLTAQDELTKVYEEIQKTKEDIDYLQQKLDDTIVLSPSDGVINKIAFKTKGEAISPGSIIAEIIPESKYLLAEVKVAPSDIGFLYLGQPVRLKLRAYDFALYGAIEGEISYISADTLIDDKDQKKEIYIVHIKSDKTFVGDNPALAVKPGMSVDADILTGKKSILSYILKPIVKSLDK